MRSFDAARQNRFATCERGNQKVRIRQRCADNPRVRDSPFSAGDRVEHLPRERKIRRKRARHECGSAIARSHDPSRRWSRKVSWIHILKYIEPIANYTLRLESIKGRFSINL